MPKVASEVKIPSHSGLRSPNRPADKAEANPFAALLDTADDRPAMKPDRTGPSQPSRKSEAADSRSAPSDDAAPAKPESGAAPAGPVTCAKDDSGEGAVIEIATVTDPASFDTTQTAAADALATLDVALAATPAPQIAPVIAIVAPPPIPAEIQNAAPAADAVPVVPASDNADMPAPTQNAAAPMLPQSATPETDENEQDETKSAANAEPTDAEPGIAAKSDPLAPQKLPRDGSHLKPDAQHQKPNTETTDNTDPVANQAKPDAAADSDTPRPVLHAAPAADAAPGFTLSSLHSHNVVVSAQVSSATLTANTVPIAGLAVEIATQARAGGTRFEIRLDPPELGRIDVRLDIDKHGQVTSHLRVDRVETLDMLRRDASTLERALQDAGLKTSDNALNFSLRDQSLAQHRGEQTAPNSTQYLVTDDTLPIDNSQSPVWATRLGGIDIRV